MTQAETLQAVAESLDRSVDTIRGWIKDGHASIQSDGTTTLDLWAVSNLGKSIKIYLGKIEWAEGRIHEQNQDELALHKYIDLAHLLRFYGQGESPSVKEFLDLPSWEHHHVIESMQRRVDSERFANDR